MYIYVVRCMEVFNFVWVRQEVFWIFCVNMIFNGMVVNFDVFLFERQWLICGDMQLFFDQVNVSNYFCYWVFNLNMCVYFNEVEFIVFVQEFKGISVVVVDFDICMGIMFIDEFMYFFSDIWCGCFFYYFLVMVLY